MDKKCLAWFDEIPDAELALTAGGKGASLCRLTRGGLPVPEGFIVCADLFTRFMEECGLRDKVLAMIDGINFEDNNDLVQTAEKIREMIVSTKMPEEMFLPIQEFYGRMKTGPKEPPVAVRSSGTAEDLDDASFAGQQETYLYVIGPQEVVHFIKECWASLYNDRAIFYRREKGFDERDISIAVVVQRMVAAEKSGVMFTAHPISGDRDSCMVESSWGLGEAIVSGIVTPDSYTLDKTGKLLEAYISEKETMVCRKPCESGVEEREVPPDKREAQVLCEKEMQELVALAVRVEEYFGKPQDVEWAIEGDKLYLLQSRPITTLGA